MIDWFLAKYGVAERLFLAKFKRFYDLLCRKGHSREVAGQCFLGLVRASELYDPARGYQFDTYCLPHQYAYCQRLLWDEDKLTGRLAGRQVMGGIAADLESRLDRSLTAAEDAEALAAVRSEVRRILLAHAGTDVRASAVRESFPETGDPPPVTSQSRNAIRAVRRAAESSGVLTRDVAGRMLASL